MTRTMGSKLPARLVVEPLECRCVPAGNIMAELNGGSLVLRGDDLANGVVVTSGAETGQFLVIGFELEGVATTVNGQAAVVVSGVTQDVVVDLRAGNDLLAVVEATIPRDLRIQTGLGNDLAFLAGVTVGEDLEIGTGLGNDIVALERVTAGGGTRVETGDDSDAVLITGSLFRGELRVGLGTGDDVFALGSSRVEGNFEVDGGDGTDAFADLGGNLFGANVDVRNVEIPS